MTYLDGELLFKLPQLYGIQLGGPSNRWRCDCKLRKLVRQLLPRSHSRSAQATRQQTDKLGQQQQGDELHRANILLDEPSCFEPQKGEEILLRNQSSGQELEPLTAAKDSSIVKATATTNDVGRWNNKNDDDDDDGNYIEEHGKDGLLASNNKMGHQTASNSQATMRPWKSVSKYIRSNNNNNKQQTSCCLIYTRNEIEAQKSAGAFNSIQCNSMQSSLL